MRPFAVPLLVLIPAIAAAMPLDGAWQKQTGWYCGAVACKANERVTGPKLRIIEAVWLRSKSGKVCGFWHSKAGKVYRGLVIGHRVGNQVRAAYSQEIDHDSAFYEVKELADIPVITPHEFVVFNLAPSGLQLRNFYLDGRPNGGKVVLRPVARSRESEYGPTSAWENEFVRVCLAGSDPSIERVRNGVQPLGAARGER